MCSPFSRKNKMGAVGEDLAAEVFSKYCDGEKKMGPEQLLRFLHTEQGEDHATLEDAKNLLELNRKETSKVPKLHSSDMKKEDFISFVLNPKLNGAITNHVYQDMTRPISHYYIFTGHNSYLTGNQLSSASSEVPIINALKRGVRVVELDLWPDDEGGIKVTHGNTLTDPVTFEKCLVAIKDNAFVASPYPVCVTLEDHLTCELQAQAAQMILRIFGDALYYPPSPDALKEFPSPEDLKKRIIVSTKPPKEILDAEAVQKPAAKNKAILKQVQKEDKQKAPISDQVAQLHINQGGALSPGAKANVTTSPGAKPGPLSPGVHAGPLSPGVHAGPLSPGVHAGPLSPGVHAGPLSPGVHAGPLSPGGAQKGLRGHNDDSDSDDDISKKAPEYSRLITIRQVKPVKGTALKDRLVDEEYVKRISLAESKIKDIAEQFPELLVKFTQRNILRVYPAGTRIDSSNYNPVLSWNHGCQMVALNQQGYGKELWQAHGRFRSNGGCGYVLKPKVLMENTPTTFNPLARMDVKMVLRVKVMMSLGWDKAFSKRHFDLFSPPDFFTRVLIAGVPADVAKWKTQPMEDTWVPHWNEEYDFSIRQPELALLRIEVRDDDEESKDEFEGQTCLPITELKDGYRCVQLYDKTGVELAGVKMLVHFQKLYLQKSSNSPISNPLTPTSPF